MHGAAHPDLKTTAKARAESSDRDTIPPARDAVEQPAQLAAGRARIGPNAIIQLKAVLCERFGPDAAAATLAAAGLEHYRDAAPTAMVDQAEVARLHHEVRQRHAEEQAIELLREAGDRTGGYILAHRIPRLAVVLLPRLPRWLSSRLLLRAIATHAWTFAGSGDFCIAPDTERPHVLVAQIAANPIVALDRSREPICHWHCAVFQRLFRTLVSPRTVVHETDCCAVGAARCRFEIQLDGASGRT